MAVPFAPCFWLVIYLWGMEVEVFIYSLCLLSWCFKCFFTKYKTPSYVSFFLSSMFSFCHISSYAHSKYVDYAVDGFILLPVFIDHK